MKLNFLNSDSRTWIAEALQSKYPCATVVEILPVSHVIGRRFAIYAGSDLLLKEVIMPWEKMYAAKDLRALIKLYQDITRETFGLE